MTAATGEPIIATMSPVVAGDVIPVRFHVNKPNITAYQVWQLQNRRRALREEYLHHWEETRAQTGTGRPVDAIIGPVAAYAAPPHGQNR